jgi:serine/threonine protein kinase/tetratricopeptide (TPR) repeat protein
MDTQVWQQVRNVFHAALELPVEKRTAFLDESCSDPAIRQEVESLLRFHDEDSDLMESSPLQLLKPENENQGQDPWVGNFIGPYQVVAKVGEGGMGAVYRAIRVDDQYLKQVAIKVIRSGVSSSHYLRRFKNERQIMASLDHPNIARLLDGGATKDGLPYFVMEFIEGERIDDYCDKRKLSITGRLNLFREVCAAVQYAHQRLVVHRDLKPGNILVTEKGVPKLLDFGIAKLLDPELFLQTTALTMTLMKPMTPECASPEQIHGEPITTASDVYSLGVLLYRLLTGHPPFRIEGRQLHELAREISETEPTRPSLVIDRVVDDITHDGSKIKLTPEIVSSARDGAPEALRNRLSGDLDNILLKALRREPERRYSSVEQFSEDIKRHLDGLPVLARKDTIRYRTVKFVKRHKTSVAAGILFVVTLIAGIVATSWQAHVARQERQRAEQRFNDVRQLARSVIFELEPAIADLSGSTAARKLLVDNAVRYLDTLAKEAKEDHTLQRELADAYLKLADVQGNPLHANLGDTASSIANYKKVVAMREALVAANPKNQEDRLQLAIAYRWLGQMLVAAGDLHGGLDNATKAMSIMEELTKLRPNDLTVIDELENDYEAAGDIYGGNGLSANLGNAQAAIDYHRKALASAERRAPLQPDNPSPQHGQAIYNAKIGDDQIKLGDRAGAMVSYRKALDIYERLTKQHPSPRYVRIVGLLYTRVGDAHLMDSNYSDAAKNYQISVGMAEKLVADDPKDFLVKSDLAVGYGLLGKAIGEAGRVGEGLDLLAKAINIMEKLAAQDPNNSDYKRILGVFYMWRGQIVGKGGNIDGALADHRLTASLLNAIHSAEPKDVEARVTLAETRVKIGSYLAQKGNNKEAMDTYKSALSELEPFAHADPPNLESLYASADAYAHLGQIAKTQATEERALERQVELWTEARAWFEKSSATWKKIPNPARMTPTGFTAGDPRMARENLAACDTALSRLGKPAR